MLATLGELQRRLSPRTVAQNVWDSAVERSTDAAEDAAVFVKARPNVAVGGLTAVVGLFAIPRLIRAFRRKPKPALAGTDIHSGGKPLWLAAPVPYEEKQP